MSASRITGRDERKEGIVRLAASRLLRRLPRSSAAPGTGRSRRGSCRSAAGPGDLEVFRKYRLVCAATRSSSPRSHDTSSMARLRARGRDTALSARSWPNGFRRTPVDAALTAYRAEGHRLVSTERAVDLVERALHGDSFTPRL